MPLSLVDAAIRRPLAFGAAVALAAMPLAAAGTARDDDAQADAGKQAAAADPLIEAALARYPADDISSRDRHGRYDVPKPADSADARAARALLTKAAATGSGKAHLMLGKMAEAGVGGPQDFAAARAHFTAAGQDREAQWRLGLLVLAGDDRPADPRTARDLFRRSSAAGQIDASWQYGRMLEMGEGGGRDVVAARKVYADTLDYCHGDIADRYSVMLMRGIGGPVDRTNAARFQIRAFECHNRHFAEPAARSRPEIFDRETIVEMQKQLRDRDYDGPLDGGFNPKMMAALRALF